jgi:hypothetical protein
MGNGQWAMGNGQWEGGTLKFGNYSLLVLSEVEGLIIHLWEQGFRNTHAFRSAYIYPFITGMIVAHDDIISS